MPLNIPENYFEVSFVHSLVGSLRPLVTTLGLFYRGAIFNTDALAASDEWDSQLMPAISDQVTHVNTVWRSAEGTVLEVGADTVGGNGGAAAPPNVAYLVKKVTTLPGRRGRGRMYIPGVIEGNVNAVGVLSDPGLASIQGAINDLIEAEDVHGFTPFLLHNGATAPTEITTMVVQQLVATQRRRLRK